MDEKGKRLLTRAEDRVSFLYVDKARIEQTEYSVQILQGRVVSGCLKQTQKNTISLQN